MYIVVIGLGEVGRHLLSVLDHEERKWREGEDGDTEDSKRRE